MDEEPKKFIGGNLSLYVFGPEKQKLIYFFQRSYLQPRVLY